MTKDAMNEDFGCEKCFGASAEAFWASWPRFNQIADLVDDPHHVIRVVSCSKCGQRYVAVTTEFVDWQDGEDPIHRSIVPVTLGDSERMLAQGRGVDLRLIESLGSRRRPLCTRWPEGERSVRLLVGGDRAHPGWGLRPSSPPR